MEEKKVQNHSENSNKKDWVFVPIRKELIVKRTNDYVLVKMPYGYSAIISGKFVRQKESDTHIYTSMPYNYKIKERQTEYDTTTKKWNVVDERQVYPRQFSWELHIVDEFIKEGKQPLEDLLAYSNLNVDTDKAPFEEETH